MITISSRAFSQAWDKKSIDQRRTEICYKICKEGGDITQKDFTDLFEKGLLEILVKNCNSDKDVKQINMIIENSRKFFNTKCKLYLAKADSVYKSYIENIKADSIAVPENTKKD